MTETRSHTRDSTLSEIDAELKWVEENIPAAPGAALLPTDSTFGENRSARERSRSESPGFTKRRRGGGGWFSEQPMWLQFLVAFVLFIIGLNLLLWLSGTGGDTDISSQRGYNRVVHLTGDDDPTNDGS
eukprot:m.462067 g.462067  ORF g.462067 m.462067 type:complete len:129 (+) comp21601_c1_seq10:1295-1681(+)